MSSPTVDTSRSGACSACRARKIKCSGERPTCVTCRRNEIGCTYIAHVDRKRKKKDDVDGHSHGKRSSSSAHKIRDHRSSGQAAVSYEESAAASSPRTEVAYSISEVPIGGIQPEEALFQSFDYNSRPCPPQLPYQSSQPLITSDSALDSHSKLDRWRFSPRTQSNTRDDDPSDFQHTLQELLALPPAFDPLLPQAYLMTAESSRLNEISSGGDRYTIGNSQQPGSTGAGVRSSPRQHSGKYRVPYFRYEQVLRKDINVADCPTFLHQQLLVSDDRSCVSRQMVLTWRRSPVVRPRSLQATEKLSPASLYLLLLSFDPRCLQTTTRLSPLGSLCGM